MVVVGPVVTVRHEGEGEEEQVATITTTIATTTTTIQAMVLGHPFGRGLQRGLKEQSRFSSASIVPAMSAALLLALPWW